MGDIRGGYSPTGAQKQPSLCRNIRPSAHPGTSFSYHWTMFTTVSNPIQNEAIGQYMLRIFIVVPCMLFQSLLYCSNSCTSLHFKTLKSHIKTLKIRPYMFRSPLKPSSGGPWPYFARLLNWNVDLTLRRLMSYIYGAPILDVSRSHTTTQHSR